MKKVYFLVLFFAGLIAFNVSAVHAGSLTPSLAPAATGYTLSDIYNRLVSGASAIAHTLSAPGGAPAATGYTLTQIYNAIPAVSAKTLLANMWNGDLSAGGYPGGSQGNGGVDDYNNGGATSTNRYNCPLGWTKCNSNTYNASTNPGGNYCNTGAAGAETKDNCTNLVWSAPCKGAGCSSFTESSPTFNYTWDTSGANNASASSSALCSAGAHGQAGWYLPHQKQWMQAYIDGGYGYLDAQGINRFYWTATTRSDIPTNAWLIYLYVGYVNVNGKTSGSYLRCVRPAP
jgi:hypothetical protein